MNFPLSGGFLLSFLCFYDTWLCEMSTLDSVCCCAVLFCAAAAAAAARIPQPCTAKTENSLPHRNILCLLTLVLSSSLAPLAFCMQGIIQTTHCTAPHRSSYSTPFRVMSRLVSDAYFFSPVNCWCLPFCTMDSAAGCRVAGGGVFRGEDSIGTFIA